MTPANSVDPLAQLRDIHMPEAIGYWPPAPGWWILAVILLAAFGTLLVFLKKKRQSQRYRKLALQQLSQLQDGHKEPVLYLAQINRLLKQTLLAAPTPNKAAGLTGKQWLYFLDRSANTDRFSNGPGKWLIEGPYLPANTNTIDTNTLKNLHSLVEHWIKTHRLQGVAEC